MLLQAPSTGLPFPGHRTLAEVERHPSGASKTCAQRSCGEVFYRRRGLTNQEWEKRKYCSHACADAARVSTIIKTCAMCDKPYPCPPNKAARKYCSVTCSNLARGERAKLDVRIARIRELAEQGLAGSEIARRLGILKWTFWRLCATGGIKFEQGLLTTARPPKAEPAPQPKPRSDRAQAAIDAIKVKLGQVITLSYAKRRSARPGTSFETMEEYLARGGSITRCPPMWVAPPSTMCHPRTVEGGRVSAGRS